MLFLMEMTNYRTNSVSLLRSFAESDETEDLFHDDKHRDFFRVLREHHVDAAKAHIIMRLEEPFINELCESGVLDLKDREDLVMAHRSMRRPSVNKKLLDIINSKSPELQKHFAEQLRCHQPHILRDNQAG